MGLLPLCLSVPLLSRATAMDSVDEEPPPRASIGYLLLRLVLEKDRTAVESSTPTSTHVAPQGESPRCRAPPPTSEPLPAPLDTPHLFLTLEGRRTVLETDDG